ATVVRQWVGGAARALSSRHVVWRYCGNSALRASVWTPAFCRGRSSAVSRRCGVAVIRVGGIAVRQHLFLEARSRVPVGSDSLATSCLPGVVGDGWAVLTDIPSSRTTGSGNS